ncbi:hypothetical protein PYCCODRAFT_1369835 [Trametes coccinea BRFM310]|uniref:DUF6535 domain-containing protein n=1 Tax=Trametes coccinea (strain BRFM310) TaxID=1353009 RepID=A0A1Y2IIW6_TRAC3|nr:hypothetical protein PYCCODRAFT_1369835 [Trametes coccinea BRFM310]
MSREDAYREAASLLRQRDNDLIRAWADQADGLVTFAALFSGVVTAFLVDSNAALMPDQQAIMVDLLRQISAQLAGQPPPAATSPSRPSMSAVVQNALLFASLICSLLSAGLGVFHKEWLREYNLYLPLDPQKLLRAIQHRYEGRETFRMWFTIASISIFLQLGVAFFIGATLVAVWPLFPILRNMLGAFIVIWLLFWVGTAFMPTFASNCPFKSPLARFIFVGMHLLPHLARSAFCRRPHWRLFPTLEDHELQEIMEDKRGERLERAAFKYLHAAHQGDSRITALERRVQTRPRNSARELRNERNARSQTTDSDTTANDLVRNASADDPSLSGLPHLWTNPSVCTREPEAFGKRDLHSPFRRDSADTTSNWDD